MTRFRTILFGFLATAVLCGQDSILHPQVFVTEIPAIRKALVELYTYSPSAHALMDELVKQDLLIEIRTSLMTNRTAGRTWINDNGTATISMDLYRVLKTDNALAPLVAHELFHVKDGLILHTPETFNQTVTATQNQAWSARPHEKVAIQFEEMVRKELNQAKDAGLPTQHLGTF